MSFQIHKNHFFDLTKNWATTLTSSHLYEKMSKIVVLLWIHSSRQVGYMLEKIQIIWNYITYRKKMGMLVCEREPMSL